MIEVRLVRPFGYLNEMESAFHYVVSLRVHDGMFTLDGKTRRREYRLFINLWLILFRISWTRLHEEKS